MCKWTRMKINWTHGLIMFQSIKLVNVSNLTFREGNSYVGVLPTLWEHVFYFTDSAYGTNNG
jgi:hypothetical protein